ncbi:hypothetical protein [Chitinophaga japonensis]|uniref:Uncharacterized protein n=1 Tax=Chitinophaga japonensis TaxID=104662 RepID=A0A562TCX8_CHIJA|nr:hypothetical protein [Chitinophaga japonensis]TWI91128.1 hypothetical protein LX66_0490 [Chitinophaga japonensis]
MKRLTFLLVLLSHSLLAQQHIAQFAVWEPGAGGSQAFETGYRQHLLWHKDKQDPWAWYGWFIISGPRYGTFVDATFDHDWSDFDHAVDPAGDRADNALHVHPFAEVKTVFKAARIKELCMTDSSSFTAKYLRMLTLEVSDINNGIRLIAQLRSRMQPLRNFGVFQVVDGGDINRLILLLGFDNFAAYGRSEALQATLLQLEAASKLKTIHAISSETLAYRADMSLIPGR